MNKLLLALSFLLVGCAAGVVCNDPYIAVGDSCCLDNDANGICDNDERDTELCEPVVDCSACPPNIITETETVEVTRFVCKDGKTTVKDIDDCEAAMGGPEVEFEPVLTNEDDQVVIEKFSVRPACRGGYQAVEVYFKVGTAANDLELQVKTEPDAAYEAAHTFSSPVFEKYMYGVFCDDRCTSNADFFIKPGEKYLMRAKFDMTDTSWERIFYSNEHILDATDDGEYMTKLC